MDWFKRARANLLQNILMAIIMEVRGAAVHAFKLISGNIQVIYITWSVPDLYLQPLLDRNPRVTRQDLNPNEKSRIQKKVSEFHIGYKIRSFGSNCCFNGVIINNPRSVLAAGMAFMTSSEVINYCRHQLRPTINRCVRTTHHFTTQSSQFPGSHFQTQIPGTIVLLTCGHRIDYDMSNSFAGDKKTAFWWIE